MNHGTPGLPVHLQLLEFTQIHIHWIHHFDLSLDWLNLIIKYSFPRRRSLCYLRFYIRENICLGCRITAHKLSLTCASRGADWLSSACWAPPYLWNSTPSPGNVWMLVTLPIIPSFLGDFFVGSLNTESFFCFLAGGFNLGIPVVIHSFWAFSLLTTYFLCIYSVSSSVLNPTDSVAFSALLHNIVQFSSVQSLSRVRLFATPWTAARQASLSITNSRSSLKLTSIESVIPSSHLILCRPLLLLPPIPPSIRVFSNESTLRMR